MSFGARDAARAPQHAALVTRSWRRTGDGQWMPELCSNAAACTVCTYIV